MLRNNFISGVKFTKCTGGYTSALKYLIPSGALISSARLCVCVLLFLNLLIQVLNNGNTKYRCKFRESNPPAFLLYDDL